MGNRIDSIKNFSILCLILGLLPTLVQAPASSQSEPKQNWSQWRGPNRDGTIEADAWPQKLGAGFLKQNWRVELQPSYSGPIVVGNRVIVTETANKQTEIVRALDLKTGQQIWKTEWSGAIKVPFFARENGDWIRSTPASDGRIVVVAGMRDLLVCLDAETGKTNWKVDFVKQLETPVPDFGFVCSPLIDDESVYVQAGASFVRLDKRSGKIIWRTLVDRGGMYGSAFSSPVIEEIQGQKIALVQTRNELAGVRLEDGEVLWQRQIKAFRGMNILTPTVFDGAIFTSSYGGTSGLYQVSKESDAYVINEKWKNPKQGYMSSPIVIDGHAYMHLRNRRFTCIDLKSGETKWTTSKSFGKYWSMVANGNQILSLDENGTLRLIQASPDKFQLVDERKVADDSWAHLAIQGDQILIRELGAVTAYTWKKQ